MQFDTHQIEGTPCEEMRLNLAPRTIGEWREFLNRTSKTPWTQTVQYASAAAKVAHQTTHFATLERGREVVGIVAIQELKLGPIHHVTITRGPLWLKGHENIQNQRDFSKVLKKAYPKRPLRRLRWMPEWTFTEESGLKKSPQSFETLWMDLTPSLEVLRSKLHRKWRGHLNKAERSPLEVAVDFKGVHLDYFLKAYDTFKAQKKFEGPQGIFFKHEIEGALPYKDAIILWARLNNVPVAGVVVMKHGTSASYRVSWNTAEGRQHNAHFLLIWKAIEILKKHNVETFDLGGILPDDSDGLNIFKRGLNGDHFKTQVLK